MSKNKGTNGASRQHGLFARLDVQELVVIEVGQQGGLRWLRQERGQPWLGLLAESIQTASQENAEHCPEMATFDVVTMTLTWVGRDASRELPRQQSVADIFSNDVSQRRVFVCAVLKTRCRLSLHRHPEYLAAPYSADVERGHRCCGKKGHCPNRGVCPSGL